MSNPDKTFEEQLDDILSKLKFTVVKRQVSMKEWESEVFFEVTNETKQALLSAHQSDIERIIPKAKPPSDPEHHNEQHSARTPQGCDDAGNRLYVPIQSRIRKNFNDGWNEACDAMRDAINTKEEEKTT